MTICNRLNSLIYSFLFIVKKVTYVILADMNTVDWLLVKQMQVRMSVILWLL